MPASTISTNLTIMVDSNGLQGFGATRDIANLEPIAEKFRAFGLSTQEVDGHDLIALGRALRNRRGGPDVIVARHAKGMRRLVHGRPDGMALLADDRIAI